jgi:hypothetical protein
MNSRTHIVTGLFSLISLAGLAASATAGPLDPPSGAIQPTYKTLSEVEARIAVNATNTPGDADSLYKITQPGSYYLTGNVTGVAGAKNIAIEISAANVTLDLNGFAVDGAGQSKTGVLMSGAYGRVHNGSIRNLSSGRGIWITNDSAVVEDMRLSETAGLGVDVDGDHASLRRLNVTYAIGGIDASAGDFVTIEDSKLTNCYDFAIKTGQSAAVESVTVDDVLSYLNPQTGISLGAGSTARECKVWISGSNAATSNYVADEAVVIDRCVARLTGANATGITINGSGVTLTNSQVNGLLGAQTGRGVFFNTNSNRGRVDNCTFTFLAIGIGVNNSVFNIIVRNTINAATPLQFWSDSSNTVGPLVTTTQENTLTNPLANLVY